MNISFAFCSPGVVSYFESDTCSHELIHSICISPLSYYLGYEKNKGGGVYFERLRFLMKERGELGRLALSSVSLSRVNCRQAGKANPESWRRSQLLGS